MGHPAAPDHDHHRSLWLGHVSVGGVNFWEERGGGQQIRQDEWIHYQDGDTEAGMAVKIGWYDSHNVRLLQQVLIAVLRPLEKSESWLELQSTFTPLMDGLQLAKTNFGFLGLRVAKSMSAHYGGGKLTNSHGLIGEPHVHEKQALWMDYSGPILGEAWEGITWFDHPSNSNQPTSWHTRDDGWMSAAVNLRSGLELTKAKPLILRYGFHVHAGPIDAQCARAMQKSFAESAAWEVLPAQPPWRVALKRK
jgi:hypothetical protein